MGIDCTVKEEFARLTVKVYVLFCRISAFIRRWQCYLQYRCRKSIFPATYYFIDRVYCREVGDSNSFEEKDFDTLVQQAVRVILGSVGPDYKVFLYVHFLIHFFVLQVGDFDVNSRKGSVIAPGKDIQQIWAALSAFGLLFNRRVAVHFNAVSNFLKSTLNFLQLTEYTGEF